MFLYSCNAFPTNPDFLNTKLFRLNSNEEYLIYAKSNHY